MISICEKSRLQQLRKAKYLKLTLILHIFRIYFLTKPHTYLYNNCVNLKIFLLLVLNLDTFLEKCVFLETLISSFFFEQDLKESYQLLNIMIFLNLKLEKKKVGVLSYNTSEITYVLQTIPTITPQLWCLLNRRKTLKIWKKKFKNVLTDMAKISESVVAI